MTQNTSKTNIINNFYTAFSNGDYTKMSELYHDQITFKDDVFGELHGDAVGKMWEMLLSNKDAQFKLTFSDIHEKNNFVYAKWQASYYYGPKKRYVINNVNAKFTFSEGKIILHEDQFNLWKWSKQAIGLPGVILGWTKFFKSKLQGEANKKLNNFINS